MDLGTFSLSLSVQDIDASRDFYEKLGFQIVDGQHNHEDEIPMETGQGWLILENGNAVIGLFQGMFDANVLTFNPPDARSIQKQLKADNVELITEADESGSGPTNFTLADPDGNFILVDQH